MIVVMILLLLLIISLISLSFQNDSTTLNLTIPEHVRIVESLGVDEQQDEQQHQQQNYTINAIDSDYWSLKIAKSTIESGGMGVFAKMLIPKDSIICEYRGPIITDAAQSKLPYNDKLFGIKHNDKSYSILGEGVCAIINDCSNAIVMLQNNSSLLNEVDDPSECYVNQSYNAMALHIGSKIFILSTKEILPGDEIFYPYKWQYWKKQYYVKQVLNLTEMEPIMKIL
jgi:hypothetical protein